MDFTHSEERRLLADTIRRFVQNEYPMEKRHQITKSDIGYDQKIWAKCTELGLIGACFKEDDGGFAGDGHDIAVIFEELGRGLVVEPFLANLLAGTALSIAGNPAQKAHIAAMIEGKITLAFAHGEPESRYETGYVSTRVIKTDDGWQIDGHKTIVLNGDSSDFLVISARSNGEVSEEKGISLFLVPINSNGLDIRGYPTVDGLHGAEITLNAVQLPSASLLGSPEQAFPVIEAVIARGLLALSAEALGAMEVVKEMTLDYLRTRTQFGRPIGTFQALQHRMADILMEIEQTRSSLINAADRLDQDYFTREWALSAVKSMTGRIGKQVAEESIQLHGGIAMTWEYAVGHYAKRLVMIDHLFGDSDHHIERAAYLDRLNTVTS